MISEGSKFQTLSSFCQNGSFLKTKVALLTFYKLRYSHWIEKLILLFEYLQLMSQALLVSSLLFEGANDRQYVYKIIIYAFKLVNPSGLLSYESSDSMTLTVLTMLFCCTLLKIVLFIRVIDVSIRNKKMNSWLLLLWRWIYKLQTRVLYFLFTSLWVKSAIESQERGFSPFGMKKAEVLLVSSLMLTVETLLSLSLETQLCYFLPTKSFLSSKNNHLEILTFLQKLLIHILMMAFGSGSEALAWIACIVGIIMSIIKYCKFIHTLPLYHFEALLLQGGLLATILSLNVAYFINNILRASNYGVIELNFVIITWGLLALLANKISYEIVKIQILSLVCQNDAHKTPEILLHKVLAIKELKKNERIPSQKTSSYRLSHLLFNQQNVNIQHVFGLESSDFFTHDEGLSNEKMKQIYLLYYKELLKKYPTNFLIKLHIAYRSYKNSGPFTKTIKIVSEMKEKRWSTNSLSYSLLFYEIEKSMIATCEKNEHNLDLCSYTRNKILLDDLRNDMLKQTDSHLQVCHNIISNVSNFAEIQSSAQKISKCKNIIKKKISKLSETLPEYYITPMLCYAEYYLVANHSVTRSEKYYELYMQKYARAQKFFRETSLTQENLYQDSNAFLLISTQKTEYGKILYGEKSLVGLCGGQNLKTYQRLDILSLFPKLLRGYYAEFFKENDLPEILNKVHHAYVHNKGGYLIEVNFYIRYHPYLSQGLCLNMMIRPVPVVENTDFLLLTQYGEIIGMSKELLKLLKLKKSSMIPVGTISEHLEKVNEAFNMVLKSQERIRKESRSPRYYPSRMMSKFNSLRIFCLFFTEESAFDSSFTFLMIFPKDHLSKICNFEDINIERFCPQWVKHEIEFLEFDKANEIYKAFSEGEQEIQLYPYDSENNSGALSRRETIQSFTFSCCVQILNFGDVQIKKVSLERINDFRENRIMTKEEDVEEDYFIPTSTDRIQTARYDFNTASHIPTSPNGDSPLISRRDTKQKETIMTLAVPIENRLGSNFNNMEAVPSASGFDLPDDDEEIYPQNHRPLKRQKTRKISKASSSHNHPLKSTENAENRAYRSAILMKSYPKSFTGLCCVFYLVLILTFAFQLIVKSISNQTMKDLQIRKDLLKESEERLYKSTLIQINGRGMMQQYAGGITAGGVYNQIDTVIENLQLRVTDMVAANKKMLDLVYSLDKETQEQLFFQDVLIKGTYLDSEDGTYEYMNTFQITDDMVNAIKTLATMNTTKTPEAAFTIFNYLAINLVDDFLSKSREITDILTANVDKQKESFQYTTNLFLTLNPFLFVSIGILLVSIVWNQYRIENKNLEAFIKISAKEVRIIANRLAQFKKDLLNEDTFEKKWISRTSQNSKNSSSQSDEKISVYSKSSASHKIQYKEFRRRYYNYVLRVVLCISALVAITIWDLTSTQRAIKVIYNRQSQLQFANYISNRVTVGGITYAQLFFVNNTIKVENQYPLDSLPKWADLAGEIQTQIPKRFLEADGTYNPEVQKIIYENNPKCQGFTPDFLLHCTTLLNEGQRVNMIVVISAYQTILQKKYQDYVNSNKSTRAELKLADELTETPLPYFIVIAEEAHRIAGIMDGSMTYKINQMHAEKKGILIVFTIGLVVVGILIWFFLLKMIREVENDFKKVLQIFPVNLVLSSFLLKRFLQKSSRNPLLK